MKALRFAAPCLVLAALALHSLPAAAQKLYRCGNSFSQTPCAADAISKPLPNDTVKGGGDTKQGHNACVEMMRKSLNLPDSHTVTIESAKRGKTETIQYAEQTLVARTYIVSAAIRNAMGNKTGEQTTMCYLSEDEQRVLKVAAP